MKVMRFVSLLSLLFALAYSISHTTAAEADWPQWRGPLRNGLSPDTGLLKQWPANGPATAWKISGLGEGYGSVSMRGDRLLVQGTSGTASVVFCLNRADGKTIWQAALGPKGAQDRGNGPRGTPTIDGDKVYVLTENGDLAALRFRDGGVVWRKNILKEFGGSNPHWLISESPLIDGNRLIVSPGGGGASLVALDKNTGNVLWKSSELSDGPAYSSSIAATVGGVPMYLNFTDSAAVGVRATDGKLLWKHGSPSNRTANCTTPIFADNKVFFTSAYGTGAALLNLTAANGGVTAQETYFTKEMKNHHGGVVLVNGYLYGFSDSILTCMEFATGKVMWRDRSVGKGSLTYADGMLYLLGEGQRVGLAEANPQAYVAKGGFAIQDFGKPSWAHPVVIGGKLYIRNQGELTAYNVK
ncbi:MAG: PQQ-like beta-propeller repeat protein [Acidobacteria bacterium]|nr:PQQ-like beta-propeller repeat protein [Acidobacteriota bacterium]